MIEQKFSKTKEANRGDLVTCSDQPYSKWQAIFNLEQIKERNKPILPKKALPKAPFFLFDLDKAMAGENDTTPNDLLKSTFFNKDQQEENALQKHGFEKKLKEMLGKSTFEEIISYLKTLSPSGVELEFISLASIEVGKDPNEMVSKLL